MTATATDIQNALAKVGREALPAAMADRCACAISRESLDVCIMLESNWPTTDLGFALSAYRAALAEIADPAVLARRLRMEAAGLDKSAAFHDRAHADYAKRDQSDDWNAHMVRSNLRCAQEARADAAAKRAWADQIEAQRVAA